jgi:hypothetical protein
LCHDGSLALHRDGFHIGIQQRMLLRSLWPVHPSLLLVLALHLLAKADRLDRLQ